ncbi:MULTISPECIES: L7Ae/L30e/S12e/Gadd45 family ribosomal protein [Carboxydothermus]|uniref:Ribosomal protein L7ae family protein n=2 Tax=Carboxydothermus TaxID=129957 RepID=Q3A9Q9_CARHZ|nr:MULTISPECIES: ribosomal L7Ae/L30e/S12e/Gadd45 family protein [Carboxydothermus]ABB14912.1 ribosomal protein L7ae family protein [Carboxydothermus hydrogenoformans Z-2901]NYE57936.1 large subunit ribosomal protein L7A [Carboxydothermus ferrireducens DSM 11255]
MPLSEIKETKNRTVGTKQTLKALQKGKAIKVFIALDAEKRVTDPVVALCKEKNVPVETVDTMAELGKSCGIAVGCACAAIIDPGKEV